MTRRDPRQAHAGLAAWARLFGDQRRTGRTFDRRALPTGESYLEQHGLLDKPARKKGKWALIRCPAHKGGDEAHPSMSVSLLDGHFRCHACGASGGDVIALHRLITGCGFLDALRELRVTV